MIKIYILPNCPKCEDMKNYMRKKHITFEEANVERNPKALAKMTLEGIDKYPAIEINGRIYSGDVNKLKKIISV